MIKLDDITIITQLGSIELEGKLTGSKGSFNVEVDGVDISEELAEIIGVAYEVSQIFFTDTIDISDSDVEDDDLETLVELIAGDSFDDLERVMALKKHLGLESISSIASGYDSKEFEVDGNEGYRVLDDDEADEEALEGTKDLLDDIGIEGLSEWARTYILENFANDEWFQEYRTESSEGYAEDIKSEGADEPYVNRLHEECVEEGIMDAPEWPEEPEESDFTHDREEYVGDDEDEEAEHEEEQDTLESDAVTEYEDAVEVWESETEDYRRELEDEAEGNISEFAEARIDDNESGYDWFESNFGNAAEVAKDNDLVDMDEAAEWLVGEDGRGQTLASYDSAEDFINITFKGSEYEFYIYRTN